ncbi:MAG TPA: diguanylate cyclase [Myxococcaceae bacterium]|nr:diguanylate cyclase [Myxococcaceae bacterium]
MARVLLVDDEKVARAMYGDYLVGAGHEVQAVGSIEEAKTSLSRVPYDVVVTDLLLPEGDGMEVLRHVKENYPGAEVLVITALDKVDPAVRAIKSGAAEYLVKPVAPEALQHAVSRALTTRQLLRENASLREHVTLLEAGQRIATTLDRERLVSTACSSLAQVAHADAVMIYVRQGAEELRLQGWHGLEDGAELKLAELLAPHLKTTTVTLPPIEPLPEPFRAVLASPATEGGAVLGFAVLLFREKIPEAASRSASYLAHNLGVALKNLGRFAEVEDLAYLDDLTHLFNTRYLELVLERELKHAEQGEGAFSLLFLDLDYFKSVNDTHGHLVGSKLLVEIARIVKGCVRDNDVVVRYGGDEYIILLRATDSGGALKVAERIRRTVETHHFLAREGYGLSVTTCIGIASYPEHARDKAALLDLADRAMYRGKKTTRNVIYMASNGLEATPADRHSTPTG